MLDTGAMSRISGLRRYPAGATIVSEGDQTGEAHCVATGNIAVWCEEARGGPVSGMIRPGQVFGETALFSGLAYRFSAYAMTDVLTLPVSRASFPKLARNHPDILFQILETLCSGDARSGLPVLAPLPETANISALRSGGKMTVSPSAAPPVQGQEPAVASPVSSVFSEDIFPSGHKRYGLVQPASYAPYLFPKKYACPVCKKPFSGFGVFSSKLRAKRALASDFRRAFHDIEPIWFSVSVCPACLFAAMTSVFDEPGVLRLREAEPPLMRIRMAGVSSPTEPRDLDGVFDAHYLALLCLPVFGNDRRIQFEARLWRQLAWLYTDAADESMALYATERAFSSLETVFSQIRMPPEDEQATCVILGTLAKNITRYDQALKYLGKAKFVKGGKPVYRDLAEDEIEEVRALRESVSARSLGG